MGTPFTSARNGLWDASDVNTWGQGANVYPQTAADVVNIGHTVTYNKVSTVEMGAITINSGGILTFLNSMSTKLTLGHVEIQINNGGELRVGASGAGIIPKTYLAELIWNTTADNLKGLNIAAGGKVNAYGDPDYFGSVFETTLVSSSGAVPAAGNSITITVLGDFTTKWLAGQELLMHKSGAYASVANDFCRLAIVSLAANGANTDIACTVTERLGTSLTCAIHADVWNLSRNVLLYKLGYSQVWNQFNTLRPRMTNANVFGTANININDAVMGGWNRALNGYGVFFNGVMRNSGASDYQLFFATINGILASVTGPGGSFSTINAHLVNGGGGTCVSSIFNGNMIGNSPALSSGAVLCTVNGNVYSNNQGVRIGGVDSYIFKGKMGYNAFDDACANSYDFFFTGSGSCKFVNAKIPTSPVFYQRNTLGYAGRVTCEHHQRVANAHYIFDAFGDIQKMAVGASGTPTPPTANPPSGVTNIVNVQNVQSLVASASPDYLKVLDVRVWAAASVSKVYKIFVQWVSPTSHTLANTELILSGEYLDNSPAGSGHLATATPSAETVAVRTGTTDLAKYVSITINPAVEGWVNLKLTLKYYESGAMALFVDPVVNIT